MTVEKNHSNFTGHSYFIHSENGLDDPDLVGATDDIDHARSIAKAEIQRDPQRFVTLSDRFCGVHEIDPEADRPA